MKRVTWLHGKNHFQHPFIRLAINSLIEAGCDVSVIDGHTEYAAAPYRYFNCGKDLRDAPKVLRELNPEVVVATLPNTGRIARNYKREKATNRNNGSNGHGHGVRFVYYPYEVFGEQAQFINNALIELECDFLENDIDALITQNEDRARIYLEERGARVQPVIIYNYKCYRPTPTSGKLRTLLKIPRDKHLVLYEGILHFGRCLDRLLEAARYLPPDVVLVFLGQRKQGWIELCEPLLQDPTIAANVVVGPLIDENELLSFIVDADLGLVVYDPSQRNNYYCAPGKLSEYVQAGVPILAADYPSLGPVIRRWGIGTTLSSLEPREIAASIKAALAVPKAHWVPYLTKARNEFVWETQVKTLLEAILGEVPVRMTDSLTQRSNILLSRITEAWEKGEEDFKNIIQCQPTTQFSKASFSFHQTCSTLSSLVNQTDPKARASGDKNVLKVFEEAAWFAGYSAALLTFHSWPVQNPLGHEFLYFLKILLTLTANVQKSIWTELIKDEQESIYHFCYQVEKLIDSELRRYEFGNSDLPGGQSSLRALHPPSPYSDFTEHRYLALNSDVYRAIVTQQVRSGAAHFVHIGCVEQRRYI